MADSDNSINKSLAELLEGFHVDSIPSMSISGLALDSRQVETGDCFFAYPGNLADGRDYIPQAIAKGAAAIVCEPKSTNSELKIIDGIPVFYVNDLQTKIGEIAARFYQQPSKDMQVIGVTGTNGKSSCVYLLTELFQRLGKHSAMMGTLGIGVCNNEDNHGAQYQPSLLTTGNPIDIQRLFYQFKQQEVKIVNMEVSSHALDQGRIAGIDINTAIFTNLSHDHLDYHNDMASYVKAKKKLFELNTIQQGIINADDPIGRDFIETFRTRFPIIAYTTQFHSHPISGVAWVSAKLIEQNLQGMIAQVSTPWGEGEIVIPLIGEFNLSNCLAVLSCLCQQGVLFADVLKSFPTIPQVPGRMQMYGGDEQPMVIIDYAHTPDALDKVLSTLKPLVKGRLLCIFGCGGDRDTSKRAGMGLTASQFADYSYITDDNPRFENPAEIRRAICQGFSDKKQYAEYDDRQKAIQQSIAEAGIDDVIVIAGKGHETYQIINDQKMPFHDDKIAIKALHQWRSQQK